MSKIKKFESFNTHREPTEIIYDEWLKKFEIHGREQFEEKEKDFFRKLSERNSDVDSDYIGDNYVSLFMKDRESVKINKLSDNWYLIHNEVKYIVDDVHEYYICDEWDEVLGYLESKNLKLPS